MTSSDIIHMNNIIFVITQKIGLMSRSDHNINLFQILVSLFLYDFSLQVLNFFIDSF